MRYDEGDRWLAGVRQAYSAAAAEFVDPPTWVVHRAKQLFRSRPAVRLSLIQRIRAALLFDSRRRGAAQAGIRSAALLGGPWQLLYRGGDVDVDLLVRPNQDGRTMNVRGQALSLVGEDISDGVVEALPTDHPVRLRGATQSALRAEVEPTGEFALSNVERGRYDVLVRVGGHEIELNGVEL